MLLTTTIIARKRYSTTFVDDLDFTPAGSDHWSLPPHLSVDHPKSDCQAELCSRSKSKEKIKLVVDSKSAISIRVLTLPVLSVPLS
jgi:hypothetical protein